MLNLSAGDRTNRKFAWRRFSPPTGTDPPLARWAVRTAYSLTVHFRTNLARTLSGSLCVMGDEYRPADASWEPLL